jgi:hypothetical protein
MMRRPSGPTGMRRALAGRLTPGTDWVLSDDVRHVGTHPHEGVFTFFRSRRVVIVPSDDSPAVVAAVDTVIGDSTKAGSGLC